MKILKIKDLNKKFREYPQYKGYMVRKATNEEINDFLSYNIYLSHDRKKYRYVLDDGIDLYFYSDLKELYNDYF